VYLKRMELRGFKTFADHTELQFGPGMTGVVGPNGVGKSNITDAILWALGEQSQRAIRTHTSQDVIFSGTEKRSPLGMAEARLVLDNSDGALPIDFTEVEVYRRLYRSGESEYGINGSSCRLRDVHDLFVDTGVGQAAYSLVGQGDVEAILSARSETRRELLEEVAGIGKYRRRRQEAQRKLEATEGNVRRIADIIYELTSQREPLEKAAEKARQYRALDDQLREVELTLLAMDYQNRHDRLGKLANDQQITRADMEGTRGHLNLAEAEIEQIAAKLHALEAQLAQTREKARVAERDAEQAERAHAVTSEKLSSTTERLSELDSSEEGESTRDQELAANLTELKSQQEADRAQAGEMAAKLQAARTELKAAEQARRERVQRRRKMEDEHAKTVRRAEGTSREAEALASMVEELGERVQRLEAQRQELIARGEAAGKRLAAAKAERDKAAAEVDAARVRLNKQTQLHHAISQTLRDHRAKRAILAGAGTAAETRKALLTELAESHEGYEDTVRQVLAAAEAGELQGIHGVVGDMLEVPGKYETAVEAALGDRLGWIVTETQDDAVAAVEYLRARDMGYATFLPIASLSMVAPQATLASGDGCIGPATRSVRATGKMGVIVDHLLGDVLLMKDLESALRLTRRIGHQARAVTLDGVVVERNGAIRGGGGPREGGQVFGRQRELVEVEQQLEDYRQALAATWECEERLDRAAADLAGQVERANESMSERRAQVSELDRDLVHIEDQGKAAGAAMGELGGEIGSLTERLTKTKERQENSLRQAEEAGAKAKELAGALAGNETRGESEAELQKRREALVQMEVTLAELREKERSSTALVNQQEAELARVRKELGAQAQASRVLGERKVELTEQLEKLTGELGEKRTAANGLRTAVSEQSAVVGELRMKSEELDTSTRKLRRIADTQGEALQRIEVSLTREQAQIEHIQERLADVYEVTPAQAIEQLGDDEASRNSLARDVNQLKREIRALGHVNLSAIDECDRLSAREEFLTKQRDDLESARGDLLEIITEIDTAAEAEFMATFELVAAEFEVVFAHLFGGGRTQLYLTDPDNALESGVEVIAQPPGKRQKHLSLLSGGERALTALALLFAMLKVKPSPFCVLDEIDAALDEANTDRFVELLKEFAERSQFIVITHNPRSMEAMDMLHGVTMQQPGVSQRISVELADAQEQGRRQQAMEARSRAAAATAAASGDGEGEAAEEEAVVETVDAES